MQLPSRNVAVVLMLSIVMAAAMYLRGRAQVLMPRPEDLRYQAVLTEPIATPERRSVVAGTSALLIKDRVSGQCFLAVTLGDSVGLSPASCGQ
jgi:hypothetical protein